MGKYLKGYWTVIACACIIAGVFLYTMQYADYVNDYKIVSVKKNVILSYLEDDGSRNEIKCYGDVLEIQKDRYHYKIQKGDYFGSGEYYGVWLSQPYAGKDFSLVYAYDAKQHQYIRWHSKKIDSIRNSSDFGSVTITDGGTSVENTKIDWKEPTTDIACAAIVYLRIKLLQKLLVGYVVFEAILLMIGYLLYKKPEAICNLMHKELTAYRIKTMRWAGCILPLCGAAAIFLIRLVVS